MTVNSPTDTDAERRDPDGQSFGTVFDVLSNQRRRYAIACLSDSTQAVTLTDLAEDVAAKESDEPVTTIPDDQITAIQIALHHRHLPKLAEAGIVEYDNDRDLVWVSGSADRVERLLSLATNGEIEP